MNWIRFKKFILKDCVVIGLVLLFIFSGVSNTNTKVKNSRIEYDNTQIDSVANNRYEGNVLESISANTIELLSPEENKTYHAPMRGYYPASYGFENENHYTKGLDIEFLDEYHTSGEFVGIAVFDGPYYGHKNYFHIGDAQAGHYTSGVHRFDNPPSVGTVEFFVLGNIPHGTTGTHHFILRATDDTAAIQMRVNFIGGGNGIFQYYDGSAWQDIANFVVYTWYHHSVSFDCGAGINGQFTWITRFENGTEVGRVENIEFINNLNTLDELYLASDTPTYVISTSWDAFGFSWEPGYNIGDHFKGGLLLNFTTSEPLDWMAYSLDGGTNITILGNTTTPMPSAGSHTIQVFGNDSGGIYYQSELRSFQVWLITLLSPDNKTYHAPMSGYYPATFGFENELHGTEGTNLEFIDEYYQPGEQNAYIRVYDGPYDGHKNVLRIIDYENAYNTSGVHYFDSPPTTGTIEFYNYYEVPMSYGSHYFILRAMDDTVAVQVRINITETRIEYFDGASWQNISNQVYYEWYHHSITFDCEAGINGQFTWITRYEDGTEVGRVENIEFLNDLNTIDELYLGSDDDANFGDSLWDAFGFSWDPNYNVGDNLNEGLLLSYNTPTPLNWTGYSLDGGTNVTILGNTTIPMPSDEIHTIQVFGNDSLGNWYSSESRSFRCSVSLNIYTPKNKTYSTPMSGYYAGPYGFENSKVGEVPTGWTSNPPDVGFIEVDAELAGHKNVVELRKNGGTQAGGLGKRFIENVTAGTVEFWIYKDTDSNTDASRIHISGEGGSIEIGIENMDLYRNPYTSRVTIGDNVAAKNTWHHIRIDFDISQTGYQIYFNGVLYGSGYAYPFYLTPSEFYQFDITTHYSADNPNYGVWLDAVGFSWESNYQIGDNLNEGLLLNFYAPTQFNWTGYSIDGASNVTILGNTTIPLPSDGSHTIQVYGSDSLGNRYSSPPRSFQSFLNPPSITGPDDFSIEVGDIGKNFIWSLFDPNPANYRVYRNGSIFKEDNWTTTDFIVYISLDGLSEGNHNFTCIAKNIFARTAIDEVWITVGPDQTPPDISSPSDISFEEGSIGYTILWTGYDIFPWWASVRRNNDLIYDQAWIGNDIEISLEDLPYGLYMYNCTFVDMVGNSKSDIVEVNVTEAVPDTSPPKVTAPGSLEYEEGTTGHILTWNCSDDHPYAYKIQINDTDEFFSPWRGGNVTYSADDLPVGVWVVNLTLYDLSGNKISSPVIVTVNPEAPDTTDPTVSQPADLIIAENTAGMIVWEVDDKHPHRYTISRNGTVIYEQYYWVSGIIQFHFTSLPLGTWEFNLTVWDEAGNSASGIAIVKALPGSTFDFNRPEISHVEDIEFTYGTTNNYLIVYLFDEHPQGYSISITTDTNITEQIWTSPNIRVDLCLDDLAVGSYTVTIIAWDTFGNVMTRTVKVTVQGDVTPPTISYQPDITASENTDITLTWQVSDETPSHFELIILPEGKLHQSGSWSGNSIEIIIGNLTTGTYQYRLLVYDTSGNYAVDDFSLTVIESRGAPGFEILTAVLVLLFFTKFRTYFNLNRRKGK